MHPFREVKVWEKAHNAALHLYRLTSGFPAEEQFGLTAQMRRNAVTVPSKIADGCGRGSDRDLTRFLETARGAAAELESQMLLAKDLAYLADEGYAALAEELTEIQKMLTGFIKAVRARIEEGREAKDLKTDAKADLLRTAA
jgi:four helix bundle protein